MHIMKTNRSLDRLLKRNNIHREEGSVCHLAMRVTGVISNTEDFDKMKRIVSNMLVVLKSKFVTYQLKALLQFIQDNINIFQASGEN